MTSEELVIEINEMAVANLRPHVRRLLLDCRDWIEAHAGDGEKTCDAISRCVLGKPASELPDSGSPYMMDRVVEALKAAIAAHPDGDENA